MCKLRPCGLLMTSTTGGACAIFYTHKEDNAPINKTIKRHPKNKMSMEHMEHVAKAMEHKVGALEVTKKMDHHKNMEKKRGYEGKIFKMDTKWLRSFPKRSQMTLLVTITRYPKKQEWTSSSHNECTQYTKKDIRKLS